METWSDSIALSHAFLKSPRRECYDTKWKNPALLHLISQHAKATTFEIAGEVSLISTFSKLAYLLTGFRKRFLVSLVIGGAGVALDTLALVYFGSLVASITGHNDLISKVAAFADYLGIPSSFQVLVGLLFIIYLIKSGLLLLFNRSITRFACDLRMSLQTRLLKGILSDVPYRELSSNSSSTFSHTVVHVAHSFSSELILQSSISLVNAVTGLFIYVYLMVLNPKSTLILAVAFLIIGVIYVKTTTTPLRNISYSMHASFGRLTHIFMNTIYFAKNARIHNLQKNYIDLAGGHLDIVSQNQIRYNTIQMIPRVTFELLICLSFFIFTVGSSMAETSTQSLITQFSIFLIAAIKMLPAISQMVGALALFNANHSSIGVLYKDLTHLDEYAKKDVFQPNDEITCGDEWSAIEFSDVCFAYDRAKPVLKSLNLTIHQGQVTGISGPSGEGKSTLLDVLLGLLTPDSGKILVNAIDLASCRQTWNAKIGYMSQNLFLLDASIKENLTLSDANASFNRERAERCLSSVGLQDFATAQGLAFEIGERGARLSGGQRQRLAIARLLYSEKSVLILDEPTASLDKEAEEAVIQCIHNLKSSRTIILVSHSDELLRECDVVFEIRGGTARKSARYVRAG